MRLQSLSLEQFRSYAALKWELGEDTHHQILGANGSGKTNIVEALSYLSRGKSCLPTEQDDAVKWGEDFFRLRSTLVSDSGEDVTLEYVFQRLPRRRTGYFVRDVRVQLLNFIGLLPTIIFVPQSLDLFTGAPAQRRQFLDSFLAQLSPKFVEQRLEYERVLKQRNALLKRIAAGEGSESELELWDTQLSAVGASIASARDELLTALMPLLAVHMKELGESWGDIRLSHRATGGLTAESLSSALFEARQKDLILQSTTVGPHRDDFELLLDRRPIGSFASRGQQRTAFLSLLFGSAELFREKRGERPIVLLDDVFSELDEVHQTLLLERLGDHQVILTATHAVPSASVCSWAAGSGEISEAPRMMERTVERERKRVRSVPR